MTSPDRGESANTVLAYSGGVIDRAATHRTESDWVNATLARASTLLIPMWRDQCVMSGEPAVPVIVPAATAAAGAVLNSATEVVFLGLDDHGGIFAADLSQAGESAAAAAAGGERVLDVRALVGTLRPAEAALLGYARDLVLASPSALLRQLRVPDPHRPRRAPQDVPERGVRAPALSAGRARGDHARREPGQVPAGPAQGFGPRVVLDPGGIRRRLREPGGRGATRGRRRDGRARRAGDVHGLAGLAVPVRADGRVPGHRAGADRSRRRRGSDRGPLVYPRRTHRARQGGRSPGARRFDRPVSAPFLAGRHHLMVQRR